VCELLVSQIIPDIVSWIHWHQFRRVQKYNSSPQTTRSVGNETTWEYKATSPWVSTGSDRLFSTKWLYWI